MSEIGNEIEIDPCNANIATSDYYARFSIEW